MKEQSDMGDRPTDRSRSDTLIMGVGNILLGDEGVGIHTVKELEDMDWPEGTDLLDGGTGGFHILQVLQDYKNIILIDAALNKSPPGSIKVSRPRFSKDFPKALSSHDIGLKDLIDSANVLGPLPNIHLVAVSIDPGQELNMELSPRLKTCIPGIIEKVKEIRDQICRL